MPFGIRRAHNLSAVIDAALEAFTLADVTFFGRCFKSKGLLCQIENGKSEANGIVLVR